MTMRSIGGGSWRALWRCVLAAGVLLAAGTHALANGWEWHSIPRAALLAALDGSAGESRAYAIRAFGFRGDRAVVPRLAKMAGDDDEPHAMRAEAIRALARIADPAARAPLIALLEPAGDPERRGEIALALARIGGAPALDALLKAFATDDRLLARSAFVQALGHFSEPRAVDALAGELATAASASLRRRAAIALGETGAEGATAPLLRALGAPANAGFVAEIVVALGRAGGAAAGPALRDRATAADDPALRVLATVALGQVRAGNVVGDLIGLLEDDNPAVGFRAIQGLARQGDEAALPALIAAYGRHDPAARADRRDALFALSMRHEIVRALNAIDPAAAGAADTLMDAGRGLSFARDSALGLRLNEGAYRLRRAALWGLGYSRSAAAARFLIETAVADRDFRIRAVAVRSLGVLGRAETVDAVLARLGDEVAEVRWQAALVLGRLGEARALAPLIGALDDAHPRVRRQAATALGYLGDAAAIERLKALAANDASAKVRDAAAAAANLITR